MIALARFGDHGVRAPLPSDADARALFEALRAIPDVEDVVIAETHVAVFGAFDRDVVRAALEHAPASRASRADVTTTHVIRVAYDGEDLDEVARACGLSRESVIERHVAGDYRVKFVGFLPGFAYLGPLDETLRVPRRATPRTRVPKNALAIAAHYTGVYPCMSPGGWSLIGRAIDFDAFDPARGATLSLGDRVRFEVA